MSQAPIISSMPVKAHQQMPPQRHASATAVCISIDHELVRGDGGLG